MSKFPWFFDMNRPTGSASKYPKDLAGREKLFIHPKFIELLKNDTHQFKEYAKPQRSRARAAPPALPRKR